MMKRLSKVLGVCLCALALAGGAGAAELVIGMNTEPSIDPHFFYLTTNIGYSKHMFGRLVERDENARRIPDLAESWRPLDDTTWEFKLRKGVKFHDGSDFTAEDVIFSFERIPSLPNNPGSYANALRGIVATEALDPHTLIVRTDKPNPLLPAQIHNAAIVSRKAAENAGPGDFESGRATVGTGPYRFVEYKAGDRLVLERFDGYWGEKPAYDRVIFRVIPNDAVRVAALLGGDVHLINAVPPTEVAHLERRGVAIYKRPSDRIIFLGLDNTREESTPFATDLDGNPLPENPLRDVRVRQAISRAINRRALVQGVMEGLAAPASQLIAQGWFSYNPELDLEPFDPAGAKKLLAEAGYPNGFGLTIHGPNDRYTNDAKVCQAVAQMLSRIGIRMRVDTMPKSVYFSRLSPPEREFSFYLLGWGNASVGESTQGLLTVVHAFDREKGAGTYNGGVFLPEVDILTEQAAVTVDEAEREKILQEAMAAAMRAYNPIPLYTQFALAAAQKGVEYTVRADDQTLAMNARPVPE